MIKNFGDDNMIYSWMRNRNKVEFLGIWEQMHNPDFIGNEFDTFKKQADLNSFGKNYRKVIVKQLNEIAITQMKSLLFSSIKKLK